MKFVLFDKLASLDTKELVLLIIGVAVLIALLILFFGWRKKQSGTQAVPRGADRTGTRALVFGALCLSLSFVLSYIKLFSMPFGGSVTLCSMLPLTMYAAAFGPKRGFAAAFAYALLQIIQGVWIVHWIQFLLDYFVAFTLLGLAAFFPKRLPLGVAVAGLARLCAHIVSGAVFFGEGGLDFVSKSSLFLNPWFYSLVYNGTTVGVDTLFCVIVSLLPPVGRLHNYLRSLAPVKKPAPSPNTTSEA